MLRELDELLSRDDGMGRPGEDPAVVLQNHVYEIGKSHYGKEGLRDWFRVLYETLLGSEQGRSWANLALYYLAQNRREDAEQALRRAADAAPADSRIRDNLGALLEADGRNAEAALEYEAAVRGRPAIAQPRVRLALLLIEKGEKHRAAELLDEAAALEIDAEDARAIEAARTRLQ